ncbi:hypothetical protein Tco_0039356 [Tanacetum coccineum]
MGVEEETRIIIAPSSSSSSSASDPAGGRFLQLRHPKTVWDVGKKGPQWRFRRGENLNTRALRTGRTPLGGTSAPAGQAQGGPSPTFVKENIDSGEAESENSQMSPSAEEVGGYSSDGSSRSRSQEARSRSKSKSVKSKPQSVRASRRKSSSYSGYDTVSDSGSEDLSMPYRRPKPMPFTSRITRFRYHRRAKLSPNVRPRPKSVREFDELSSKLLDEFSLAEECTHQEVPPVLRISAFMHGHGHPELAKKLNDKIPKTVDEMWERVRDTTEAIRSPRWEKSVGKASWLENQNGSRNRSHRRGKEILAMDNVNFPPPLLMVGTPEKRNMNKFCNYHQDRGHNTNDCYHLKKQIEEAVALGRLAHLGVGTSGKAVRRARVVVEAMIEGFLGRRITLLMCFAALRGYVRVMLQNLSYPDRGRVRESELHGGVSHDVVSYPMGVIDLEVTMGECGRTRTVIMEFAVVNSPSPYNALLGRTGMRSLGAVASTIHLMMKFPTSNGIATISTTRETLRECRKIEEAQDLSRHARVTDPSPMQTGLEVIKSEFCWLRGRLTPEGKKGKFALDIWKEIRKLDMGKKRHVVVNVDVFAWAPSDMTGTLGYNGSIALDTTPIEPNAKRNRSLGPRDMRRWDDKEGRREDGFPYRRGSLLLHEDAFWPQECKGDIPEAGGLCLQGVDRGKPRSRVRQLARCSSQREMGDRCLYTMLVDLCKGQKQTTLDGGNLVSGLSRRDRRLRMVFPCYTIMVITDTPDRGKVLNKSASVGNISYVAVVEFGEYGIMHVQGCNKG